MSETSSERLNDKWLRLVGLPVAVPLALLLQMPFFFPGRWDLYWKFVLSGYFFTALSWELGRGILLAIRRLWPGLGDTLKRILITFIWWSLFVSIFHVAMFAFNDWLGFAPFKTLTWSGFRNNFLTAIAFWGVLGSIYEALYFFSNYKAVLVRAEHLKKQQLQQRFENLKSRVNPHFLFNSLTTLSALIGEDASLAEKFVDELSKVYRYLLRAGRQPLVSLSEELHFAESYIFLLINRFPEGMFSIQNSSSPGSLTLDSSVSEDRQLPVLTFQNTLDYLVRTQNLPLNIQMQIGDSGLFFSCRHQPKTLSFETSELDWKQLESYGAVKDLHLGQLVLFIPYITHNVT